MREYDRTGNGQNGEADWDLRSILCDMAKNWWIILLIACSAAMITYTVLTAVHRDQYTVKTTFAVMGRGENANAASSLSATYEMTQKFQAILENNILKKKVMEELGCSSFPAEMNELLNTKLELNSSLKNRNIRNCLAHYGLGQFMKETDIDKEDILKGITVKAFNMEYYHCKELLYYYLNKLAIQIKYKIF